MATRKDLLKAHKFTSQRLVAALVDRDPDDLEPPLKRMVMGTFAGIMIAILVTAGFGVVGLIKKGGSQNWQSPGTVVIDESSGVVFAFLEEEGNPDGQLHPTLNITSARLATGGQNIMSVKSKSLRGFPRAYTIGIPGAPDQLPDPKDMSTYPIRTCSTAPDQDKRFTTMQIAEGDVPASNATLAVKDDSGVEYLVDDGTAFQISSGKKHSPLLVDLGFSANPPSPGNTWLKALPQGTPLEPLAIEGAGKPSSAPVPDQDNKIGTLFVGKGSTDTHYILLDDGLAAIKPLESRIWQLKHGTEPVELDANVVAAHLSPSDQKEPISAPDLPKDIPTPDEAYSGAADKSLCATWTAADAPPLIAVGADTPDVPGEVGGGFADVVKMPVLHGALVHSDDVAGDDPANTLVTDSKRFGIADMEAQTALGYAETPSEPVPAQLLALIPPGLEEGLVLSIDEAQKER